MFARKSKDCYLSWRKKNDCHKDKICNEMFLPSSLQVLYLVKIMLNTLCHIKREWQRKTLIGIAKRQLQLLSTDGICMRLGFYLKFNRGWEFLNTWLLTKV